MTHHLLRLFWLIQKKIPSLVMIELLSRISVEGQVIPILNTFVISNSHRGNAIRQVKNVITFLYYVVVMLFYCKLL